jgi:hypothetical protein
MISPAVLEAVYAVEAVEKAKQRLFHPDLVGKGIFSASTVWHYRGIYDSESQCEHCRGFDNKDYLGSALRLQFPDLEVIDEYTIYVNYHMTLWGKDTCRCYLWREEDVSAQQHTYTDKTLYNEDE